MKKKIKKPEKETQTDIGPLTQNFFILPPDGDDPDYIPDEEETDDPRIKLKRGYTYDDNAYYDKLTKKQKKTIDKIELNLSQVDFFKTPMRFKILESNINIKLKQLAISKIDELTLMYQGSGEYFKLKNWIENLCKLPIGIYKNIPVSKKDPVDKISEFINFTKDKFNKHVYGHTHAKNQIIQLLAKQISNPTANGIVIGIQGPMGCGKTTICLSLCEALHLPFGFISLAGVNDEHIFKGHSYTYEGSKWGRISDILMNAQCMNPILYFDELDKISTSSHGEEVSNFLVHLTDFTQNSKFQDHYFGDIDLDLSKSIIIFSYNHEENVNPILRDRMITIRTKGYKLKDKLKLAQDYILPKILTEFGFDNKDIIFDEFIIEYIINKVDEEEGARNMKRGFEEIIGSINYKKLLGTATDFPITITTKCVDEYLLINKKTSDNTCKNMMYL